MTIFDGTNSLARARCSRRSATLTVSPMMSVPGMRSPASPVTVSPLCKPIATAPAVSAKPLRVGPYYWPGDYWIDIAHQQGWFKEAGRNVEWVGTNPNYFASCRELWAGNLDAARFTPFGFVL